MRRMRAWMRVVAIVVATAIASSVASVIIDRRGGASAQTTPGQVRVTIYPPELAHVAGQRLEVTLGAGSVVFPGGGSPNAPQELEGADHASGLAVVHDEHGRVAGLALVPKATQIFGDTSPIRPTYASTAMAMFLGSPGIATSDPVSQVTEAGLVVQSPAFKALVDAVRVDALHNPNYVQTPGPKTLAGIAKLAAVLSAATAKLSGVSGRVPDPHPPTTGVASARSGSGLQLISSRRPPSCDTAAARAGGLHDVASDHFNDLNTVGTDDDEVCFQTVAFSGGLWPVTASVKTTRWSFLYDVADPANPDLLELIPGRVYDVPSIEKILLDVAQDIGGALWDGVKAAWKLGLNFFSWDGVKQVGKDAYETFIRRFKENIDEWTGQNAEFTANLPAPAAGTHLAVFGLGHRADSAAPPPFATRGSAVLTAWNAALFPVLSMALDLPSYELLTAATGPEFLSLVVGLIGAVGKDAVALLEADASADPTAALTAGTTLLVDALRWTFSDEGIDLLKAWISAAVRRLGSGKLLDDQAEAAVEEIAADLTGGVSKIVDAGIAVGNILAGIVSFTYDYTQGGFLDADYYVLGRGGTGPPSTSPGKAWVVLGDSYSSGDGAPDSLAPYGYDTNPLFCRRSPLGWARLLDQTSVQRSPSASLDELEKAVQPLDYQEQQYACTGARISDFYNTRPVDNPALSFFTDKPEPPQLDRLKGVDAGLVSVSIGGNDLGFSDIAVDCSVAKITGHSCQGKYGQGGPDDLHQLLYYGSNGKPAIIDQLRGLYNQIVDDTNAPKIAVVGYPVFFPADPIDYQCPFTLGDARFMRTVIQDLNSAIKTAVDDVNRSRNLGGRLQYVDMSDVLAGHEYCTGKTPQEFARQAATHVLWMNTIGDLLSTNLVSQTDTPFHPNALGQIEMAKRFRCAVVDCSHDPGTSSDTNYDPKANIDMALIIDSSGSMEQPPANDPGRKRIDAAKVYLSTALDQDLISVYDFNDTVNTRAEGELLAGNRDALAAGIDAIGSGGGTDIKQATEYACEGLARDTSARPKAAILLTDGQDSNGWDGSDLCFEHTGWKLFTFFLEDPSQPPDPVAVALLKRIASETGGTFSPVGDVNTIACKFQQVRAEVIGEPATTSTCDHVVSAIPGNTNATTIEVKPRQESVTISASWVNPGNVSPAPQVAMDVRDDHGNTYHTDQKSSDPAVSIDNGKTYSVIRIADPSDGAWVVNLRVKNVDSPAGLGVLVGPSTEPFGGTPPVAQLRTSLAPHTAHEQTVTFDASASHDADGPIAQYLWDFGDGSAQATGKIVHHSFTSSGHFTPKLTVIDLSGDVSVQVGAPIAVQVTPRNDAYTSRTGQAAALLVLAIWALLLAALMLIPLRPRRPRVARLPNPQSASGR